MAKRAEHGQAGLKRRDKSRPALLLVMTSGGEDVEHRWDSSAVMSELFLSEMKTRTQNMGF